MLNMNSFSKSLPLRLPSLPLHIPAYPLKRSDTHRVATPPHRLLHFNLSNLRPLHLALYFNLMAHLTSNPEHQITPSFQCVSCHQKWETLSAKTAKATNFAEVPRSLQPLLIDLSYDSMLNQYSGVSAL